jgi:cytochrome c-type biogenesis protein
VRVDRQKLATPTARWPITWLGISVTLAGLAALFAGGYWVYTHVVGPLFFQAQSATALPTSLILALAVLAGAASFSSPCSLAITPAFLAYFVEEDALQQEATGARRLLCAALLIAAGIVGVSAVAGALIALMGAVVYDILIYLIPLIGGVFVLLGAVMLLGRASALAGVSPHLPGRRYYERALGEKGRKSAGQLLAFGAAYGAASHSCTLPVVIGILMLPIAAGSYWLAASAIVVYGAALAGLMLLMLALGQPAVIAMRRALGPSLKYVIGGLFLATGGYLLHYFLLNYGVSFTF